MEIHYRDNKQQKILTNERLILKEYGRLANSIINRLSEIAAANCLSEIPNVPPPRRHKLQGGDDMWGLDISKNHRIVIMPYGEYDITDLSSIKEIVLLRIEDYH